MSFVNVSLKLWSLNMAYRLICLVKNVSSVCICKNYSHFFSKNTCELDIVLTRTVNILTTNELVKLTMLWTTAKPYNLLRDFAMIVDTSCITQWSRQRAVKSLIILIRPRGYIVNSRYLEFQGTLWNTSRYPYLDISDLQNWGNNDSINHI